MLGNKRTSIDNRHRSRVPGATEGGGLPELCQCSSWDVPQEDVAGRGPRAGKKPLLLQKLTPSGQAHCRLSREA